MSARTGLNHPTALLAASLDRKHVLDTHAIGTVVLQENVLFCNPGDLLLYPEDPVDIVTA